MESFKIVLILFVILLTFGCKLAGNIEGSGGMYTEEDQSLSK